MLLGGARREAPAQAELRPTAPGTTPAGRIALKRSEGAKQIRPIGPQRTTLNTYCDLSPVLVFRTRTKNRPPLLVGEIKERFWAFTGVSKETYVFSAV
jgi:hypothetical protein